MDLETLKFNLEALTVFGRAYSFFLLHPVQRKQHTPPSSETILKGPPSPKCPEPWVRDGGKGERVEDEGGGAREEGEGRGWVKKACVMPSKKDNIRHRC